MPNPSTEMKETVRLWPVADENPERVMTKEDIFSADVGVNEMVAVTNARTTLEFKVTCKSSREGAMGDKNP